MSSIEGDVDVEAGGDVVFEAGRTPGIDTVIESGSGDVRVVAEGSVLLQRTPGQRRQRGDPHARRARHATRDGDVTKTDGGDVLVWAKTGDVDAGVGNRWVEPGPSFQPNGPERPGSASDGPRVRPDPRREPEQRGPQQPAATARSSPTASSASGPRRAGASS